MRLISLLCLLVFSLFAAAEPPVAFVAERGPMAYADEPKPGVQAQPRAPGCGCEDGLPCQCDRFCLCDHSYKGAHAKALKEGQPLLVFVGQTCRYVPGTVCCRMEAYEGNRDVRVIVGIPKETEIYLCEELPGQPDRAAIEHGIKTGKARLEPIVNVKAPAQQGFFLGIPNFGAPGFAAPARGSCAGGG